MNRPRTTKGPFPPCFYAKHGAFYLVKANKWTRLGSDLSLALAEYGRLMEVAKVGGMPKLIDETMRVIAATKKKGSTLRQYTYAAGVLKRKLRQFEPQEVTAETVVGIRDSLIDTPNMANRVVGLLRQILGRAAEAGRIPANPAIGIARLTEVKRERLISDDEWSAIYAKAGERLRVIMELQHLTGQRIGDVLSIRRSQLTEAGVVFRQEKTGKQLLVRWSPDLRAAVQAANALSEVPALTLLRSRTGKAPNARSVALQWANACEAAGVADARLNDGRAKSATTAKQQGHDAQALLGHTTPNMTRRYLRGRETPEVDGPSFRQQLRKR